MRCLVVGGLAAAALAAPADAAVGPLTFKHCLRTTSGAGCAASSLPQSYVSGVAISPDRRNVYVTALASDAVLVFDRAAGGTLTPHGCIKDPASGSACAASTPGLDGASDVAVSPDGESVYVVSNASDAIVAFKRAADGTLTPLECYDDAGGAAPCGAAQGTDGLDATQHVAISPDGNDVYATGLTDSSLVRFDRADDGSLTPAACAGGGGGTCVASPIGFVNAGEMHVLGDSKRLWVAGSRVVGVARNADGTLTADRCIGATGSIVCAPAGQAPGIANVADIAVTSDERRLFAADASADAVYSFTLDAAGIPTYRSCVENTGGANCGAGRAVAGLDNASELAAIPGGGELIVAAGGAPMTPGTLQRFTIEPDADLTPTVLQCLQQTGATDCPAGSTTSEVPAIGDASDIVLSGDGANLHLTSLNQSAVTTLRREVAPVCTDPPLTSVVSGASSPLTLTCADANAEPLTRTVIGPPYHGTVGAIDQATGATTFAATAGFSGGDGFTFSASDAAGNVSNLATASLSITPAPAAASPSPTPTPSPSPAADRTAPKITAAIVAKGRKRSVRVKLSERAALTLTLKRSVKGRFRKVGATIRRTAGATTTTIVLLRRAKPGRYRLTIKARDAAGNVATATRAFRVR